MNNWIFLVSYVGNRGTFKVNEFKRILSDRTLLCHVAFFVVAVLGSFVHEFFFSILVSFILCTLLIIEDIEKDYFMLNQTVEHKRKNLG